MSINSSGPGPGPGSRAGAGAPDCADNLTATTIWIAAAASMPGINQPASRYGEQEMEGQLVRARAF